MEGPIRARFHEFMQLVVAAEEAQKKGATLLASFSQELEAFRRPSLDKTSPLVAEVVLANPSPRLQAYLESGCQHPIKAAHNAARLDVAFKALNRHLLEVLSLKEQASRLLSALGKHPFRGEHESHMHQIEPTEEQEVRSEGQQGGQVGSQERGRPGSPQGSDEREVSPRSPVALPPEQNDDRQEEGKWWSSRSKDQLVAMDYLTMAACLAGMLEDDWTMQSTILEALDLGTSSAHLAAYSLMWSLRPFVDERVVKEALLWL